MPTPGAPRPRAATTHRRARRPPPSGTPCAATPSARPWNPPTPSSPSTAAPARSTTTGCAARWPAPWTGRSWPTPYSSRSACRTGRWAAICSWRASPGTRTTAVPSAGRTPRPHGRCWRTRAGRRRAVPRRSRRSRRRRWKPAGAAPTTRRPTGNSPPPCRWHRCPRSAYGPPTSSGPRCCGRARASTRTWRHTCVRRPGGTPPSRRTRTTGASRCWRPAR